MKQAGHPLLLLEVVTIRGERNTDKKTRKFVTITDMSMWEYIDKIMTHPDYDKSFNKVINSALLFGLPILYKRLFDTVEIDGEETPVSVPNEYNEDAFYFQLIRLMKEMLANEVITKSVVCSLFNERAAALQDGKSNVDSLVKGFYDRFLTVERNVKAASNSFYDAYLDLQEQFIKTVAVSCGFDIKARETCGELLRRTDVQNYFKEILHIDDFTYNKMQDYTLKVNAHKHKGEKNIQIDTIVSYMKIFYNATKAFAVYKNIDVPDFDADCFINIFGYFEKENTSLKTEMQKLKEELLSSVESGKLKESDIENCRNLLSQAEIDKLSLEDQNSELQRQISVLKDIKLSSMEEKLNKTIDLLLELKPAIVENRILTKAVGRKVGGMISGDTNIEKWIADEKDKEQI